MGESKNNPLFVTPQPAVVKRPLSCQSVITFCNLHFTQNEKRLYRKLTKYLVEEVVTTTFIQVVAQNEK